MGRPERPLDPASGPAAALAAQMRDLRRSAGNVSYRELAERAGFSPSVLSAAAGGFSLPTLRVTLAFVEACGGVRSEWEQRWREAARACRASSVCRPATGPRAAAASPAAIAPGRSGAGGFPTPAQLPSGSGRFCGRRRELDWLDQATRGAGSAVPAPVLVTGPVGIGKSALAIRWCRLNQGRYPGGVLYADLDDCDSVQSPPHDVLADFLCVLGVPSERIPLSPGQRAALYRSMLAERGVLVLLDNVACEEQVRPLLAEVPGSQTIVTSRRRLADLDGVERLVLDRLPQDESLALIAAIVGRENVVYHRQHALEITRLCDHLPLALRSIATRTVVRSGWTLAHAAQRLRDESARLSQFGAGEHDLKARLACAIRGLDGFLRRTFLHVAGLETTDIEVGAVATSFGIPVHVAEEALEALVDAGLAQATSTAGKYRTSPLFMLYGMEEAAALELRAANRMMVAISPPPTWWSRNRRTSRQDALAARAGDNA